jgi:hypothetical protein
MPTRKLFIDGWFYRVARHGRVGLVLMDGTQQEDVPEHMLRAFILETRQTARFDREEFKRQITADVSDDDCAGLLVRYRDFKRSIGLPEQAPPDVAHASLFRQRGLAAPALRARAAHAPPATGDCWHCKRALADASGLECTRCAQVVCRCGACGCGAPR